METALDHSRAFGWDAAVADLDAPNARHPQHLLTVHGLGYTFVG